MDKQDYYRWAERAASWGAEYLATLDQRPVRAQTAPGEIAAMLPAAPPEGTNWEAHVVPGTKGRAGPPNL